MSQAILKIDWRGFHLTLTVRAALAFAIVGAYIFAGKDHVSEEIVLVVVAAYYGIRAAENVVAPATRFLAGLTGGISGLGPNIRSNEEGR